MNKKVLFVTAMYALALMGCANSIGVVENISFDEESGILTFSKVEGAEKYHIVFENELGVLFEEKNYNQTIIDTNILGLEGDMTFKVSAVKGDKSGDFNELDITLLSIFGDVIFEAEDYLYNFGTGKSGSNFRDNPLASNGAYVGGIDDCGQGIYINYLCPLEGTYSFDAYYLTAMPTAYNGVWVNGVKQETFVMSEYSEWGGVGTFDRKVASVNISLTKGWNTISVMKEGDSSNNWGSFAELDYFVLHGDERKYNKSQIINDFGSIPPVYRLEAEMGSPRRKSESGYFECKNPAYKYDDVNSYSNGYILGHLDSKYDGVEWQLYLDETTTFEVSIGYAAERSVPNVTDTPVQPYASFFVTNEEISLSHNADFLDLQPSVIELEYTNGWFKVEESKVTTTITLQEGKNFLYCLKMADAGLGIFQLDYIDLKVVK